MAELAMAVCNPEEVKCVLVQHIWSEDERVLVHFSWVLRLESASGRESKLSHNRSFEVEKAVWRRFALTGLK